MEVADYKKYITMWSKRVKIASFVGIVFENFDHYVEQQINFLYKHKNVNKIWFYFFAIVRYSQIHNKDLKLFFYLKTYNLAKFV